MSLFDVPRERREKVERLEQELAERQKESDERAPRVNALWAWMVARRVSNGIGRDFEWTLQNPR